ncbi:hypothetical protein V2W45_1473906 [Cenococcum geophilum]
MSFYLNDQNGSFIVDAPISYIQGQKFSNSTFNPGPSTPTPFTTLQIEIMNPITGEVLVPWTNIPINSTGNEFSISLSSFTPRQNPYNIQISGASLDGIQTFQTFTLLTVLPKPENSGSAVRIDQFYGGLQVAINPSEASISWKPIFPFSFYTSWDWITSVLLNPNSTSSLDTFKASGYNIIHPIPGGGDPPFNATLFQLFLNKTDSLGLFVMYDMRWTYQNLASVTTQIAPLLAHPSLLLYYTGDEPDGQGDPLSAPETTYAHLKQLDPYHPTSLCLNCANFHFASYSAGADILLSDVYPIAVNTSFSPVYHTPCNATYGDCGCDDCAGTLSDISDRLDAFATFQQWLGLSGAAAKGKGPKSLWAVPQAFFDAGSFWARYPTPDEAVAMVLLALNHGATGVVAWVYPTAAEVAGVMGRLAGVVAGEEVVRFVLGGWRVSLGVTGAGAEAGGLDAAAWTVGGRVLVCVVNLEGGNAISSAEVALPASAAGMGVEKVLWGSGGWSVQGGKLVKSGIGGLEAALVVLGTGGGQWLYGGGRFMGVMRLMGEL